MHKCGVDWVLHFASPASPIDYQKYPIQTLKVGALGTHNSLGLAKEKGACEYFDKTFLSILVYLNSFTLVRMY